MTCENLILRYTYQYYKLAKYTNIYAKKLDQIQSAFVKSATALSCAEGLSTAALQTLGRF